MSTGRNNFNSSLERKGLSENKQERGKKVSVSPAKSNMRRKGKDLRKTAQKNVNTKRKQTIKEPRKERRQVKSYLSFLPLFIDCRLILVSL